jgi:geranylgeranyl diphosphate synthase type II
MPIHQFTSEARKLIDDQLHQILHHTEDLPYSPLFSSARYSTLAPGKRLRPLLALAVCETYGSVLDIALIPACALEMVHAYSLIHDDLPCMDDDDFRRGKPALHKVYPEWHALLTGDFLLTYAFETLSSAPYLEAEQKLALVHTLAKYAGAHGMIGGQMIDLLTEGKEVDWALLQRMHLGKTAGLFTAALEFGGILSRVSSDDRNALRLAGSAIGLAFQLVDDLLDEAGSDRDCGKATAVTLLGPEKTKTKAGELLQMAKEQIHSLSRPAPLLTAFFEQMVDRKN